jgi:uncharacterized protein
VNPDLYPYLFSVRCLIKIIALILLLLCSGLNPSAWAESDQTETKDKSTWGSPIRMFQRFVSRADGNRCPMYPSCSHYSAQAFAEKGWVKGLVLTCDRLVRCGRDETRLARPINVQGVRHTFDPLSANTFWWDK